LPLFLLLMWLVTRVIPSIEGKLLALQLPLFGMLYPLLAGLDSDRETLYLNLCALMFLAYTAWLAVLGFGQPSPAMATRPSPVVIHQVLFCPAAGVALSMPHAIGLLIVARLRAGQLCARAQLRRVSAQVGR
jgi:hypothetical protein